MNIDFLNKNTFTYTDYLNDIDKGLKNEESRGGENYLEYTKLNAKRMKRLNKTIKIDDSTIQKLESLEKKYIWVLITEPWCGDAAQNLPIIAKVAEASNKIELKLLLRDDHLDIMDKYLTNGARAIPKLVVFEKENMKEIATWGARPKVAQQIMEDWKGSGRVRDKSEVNTEIQLWYTKDKGLSLQEELISLL